MNNENNKNSPSEKVYNFIINKIKSKEWQPNSKIMTENELCQELNVSRVAVRQAMEKLVALGLLKKKQGAGTFVTNIEASTYMNSLMPIFLLDDKDMLSLLEFRIYFEYGNVRMFVENHDREDIEKLEYYCNEMKNNVNDIEKFYIADFNFHNTIALGTKNPIVIKISEILIEVLKNHQSILYKSIGPNIGLEYHQDILKAIKANDGKIAAMFMRRHIEAAINEYKKAKIIPK
ncbi:MAG: FadR family transcriptional regulator [Firmicutes bacterium]|nr:FadR family transcriptional regulator [Bacillota bacterium]